jgi:sodium/proline symporter
MTSSVWTISAFVVYLAIIIGIGAVASRFSSRGISEYFIAGRQLNRYVVALSAVVSGRSAWLLIGMTGMAWRMGAPAIWAVLGYILVEIALFLYYAPRLRRFAGRHDVITLPDFFAARFPDDRGGLRIIVVVIIMIFMAGYVSSQFVAGGKAFSSSFGMSAGTGILLTAGIVLAYTLVGGFLAVSWTDVVQSIFMIVALVVLPILVISSLGGWGPVWSELRAMDPSLVDPFAIAFGVGFGLMAIGLGSPGNPHIVTRYLAIDDPGQFRFVALVGTFWNVVMATGAMLIGLAGRVYFPEVGMLPDGDTENLFPQLAMEHLHPALFGVVIASVFAAIMSTADSQLLVGASAVVRDLYEKLWMQGRSVSQHHLVLMSRLVVGLLVAVAIVFGFLAQDLVFWLVLFAWAGLGASLGPTSLLALYWKRTTSRGVLAGLLAGTGVTIIWYLVPALKGMMYELVPGFIAGLLVTIVVSLLTAPPPNSEELMKDMEP